METSGNTLTVKKTVLDRLRQAGISEPGALTHLREGGVVVDGRIVKDPGQSADVPTRVELRFVRDFSTRNV